MKTSESLAKLLASYGPKTLGTARRLLETQSDSSGTTLFPTALAEFDRLSGGLQRGTLIEIVGQGSSGKFSLELALLTAATAAGEAAALVDLGDHFDPKLAEETGVELSSLLWLRPRRISEALKSTEIVLSAGFRLVVLDLGVKSLPGRSIPEATWLRFAREAKIRNSLVCLMSPAAIESPAIHTRIETASLKARWFDESSPSRLLEGLSFEMRLSKQRGNAQEKQGRLSLPVRDKL